MDFNFKDKYGIDDLIKIMEILRSENGCPWDREQDHKSIRQNLIEETYEVIEAIDNDDTELLKEELGDALLQVVFHSRIEEEKIALIFRCCRWNMQKADYSSPSCFWQYYRRYTRRSPQKLGRY